jgi:hypothetical protein
MNEAVLLGRTRPDERNAAFDATAELNRADGFDVHISLPDSIRAFAALSQTTAGEPAIALRTLVSITSPDAKLPAGDDWVLSSAGKKAVGHAVEKVQSPLVAYAFAAALEMVVDHVDLSRVGDMQPLVQLAADAQKQTESLLTATRVAGRYPHVQELSRQLGRRLNDPAYHRGLAADAIARGDVRGALSGLRAALKRQPHATTLWDQLLSLEVSSVQLKKDVEVISSLRKEMHLASELGYLTQYQRNFYDGEFFSIERDYPHACACFEKAVTLSKTSDERTLATARATSARLRGRSTHADIQSTR